MLRLFFLFLFTSNVLSWKPIMPPTSFSIRQQHPAVGGHSDNAIYETDSSPSVSSQSVSFHGNKFIGNGEPESIDATALDSSEFDSVEGRILTGGKGTYYGKKIYDIVPSGIASDQCSVDKYAFEHEGTIQYETTIPKLDQFTLCAWMRFTNHTGDHSIFTYSVDEEPREIQFWIANSMGASYFSMAVHGQTLFRLNYPLKMRKWHHACASWNGKTGEWQLWVKAERVGRGFHNRIVGHVIQPHGLVFSGGPSVTGLVGEGLHMELTMVQFYKVALSAGKAHRDHKHHHAHRFNHEGAASSTLPPPPLTPPPAPPVNPILANGQIATRLRINFAGAQPQPQQQPGIPVQGIPSQILAGTVPNTHQATIGTQFVSGQFSNSERFLSQQLVSTQFIQQQPQQQPQPQPQPVQGTFKFPVEASPVAPTSFANVGDPANVQFLDGTSGSHLLFKRQNGNVEKTKVKKRETFGEKKHEKRALVTLTDGSVIDDRIIASNPFDFDGLASFGAPAFQENLSKMMDIEDEIREHDREPAEGEVQAVLELCSVCDIEPFQKAVILGWTNVKVQVDHALKGQSLGGCGAF